MAGFGIHFLKKIILRKYFALNCVQSSLVGTVHDAKDVGQVIQSNESRGMMMTVTFLMISVTSVRICDYPFNFKHLIFKTFWML